MDMHLTAADTQIRDLPVGWYAVAEDGSHSAIGDAPGSSGAIRPQDEGRAMETLRRTMTRDLLRRRWFGGWETVGRSPIIAMYYLGGWTGRPCPTDYSIATYAVSGVYLVTPGTDICRFEAASLKGRPARSKSRPITREFEAPGQAATYL